MKRFALGRLAVTALAALSFSSILSATVIGSLDLANCSGGGVTVTATTIDWLPTGTGTGCVQTGTNTNITSAVGNVGPAVTGTLVDLNVIATPLPVANFLTFGSVPGLTFTLDSLGPGPANTSCSTLNVFESCAAFVGSPFALQRIPTGTAVVLSLGGTASDGTVPTSVWSGAFSVTLRNMTPAQVQSTINTPGGSITSTHSGTFDIVASGVPEPATMVIMGSGLLAFGLIRRRRRV